MTRPRCVSRRHPLSRVVPSYQPRSSHDIPFSDCRKIVTSFIINQMKKQDYSNRFGFLVNEVGRLYGRHFDQLSRQQLGLSRAQCRLLGVLAMHQGERPLNQAELAGRLDPRPWELPACVIV